MVDIVVFGLECYFIAACYVPMAARVVKKDMCNSRSRSDASSESHA
jgi:hypothetical protein